MLQHWNVIRPLMEAVAPATILEVGVAAGGTTARLLEYAEQSDAVVHGIDPVPAAAVDELVERHPERFILHRGRSLDVLPMLGPVDCALIDGDHNWYTVVNELRLLAAAAEERRFPLGFIHDVGWPYGRRDTYFEPDAIPAEFRHPIARGGILPGRRVLAADGPGLNPGGCYAEQQGTERNGVLTGVEDFVRESEIDFTLSIVVGFAGLGVLVSMDRLEANPVLAERLAFLDSAEFLAGQCRRIELARNWARATRRKPREVSAPTAGAA
ncbi:MAG: class I SAM-dependent methyltransferase [Solirubrobacterales bacterium]